MNKKQTKFKQTEIGMIPDDWKFDVLSKHLYIKGRIGWKGLQKSEYLKDGIAIINGTQIQDNKLDWNDCGRVPEWRYDESPEIQLKEKDIVMTKDGTIGKVAFIDKLPEKSSVASGIFVIRGESGEIDQRFLFYYFKSPIFKWLIETRKEGSVVPHLYQRDFEEIPFSYPLINEQQLIAKILSDIDSRIELNQSMNKTLEAIGQSLFKHWFVDFEFSNEKGKPYKSSNGDMINSELGMIPKVWKVKSVGEVVTVKGGTTPSTSDTSYWKDGTISWCTPKDLSNLNSSILLNTERKISKDGLKTISSGSLPKGTVLLSSRAPIGYLVISEIETAINQGFIGILCNKEISNVFIFYWIKNNLEIIKNMANGSTFQEVNKSNFKSIKLVVPSPEILKRFDTVMNKMYNRIVLNEKETYNLKQARDSLLPKLMSGKIRVPIEVRK